MNGPRILALVPRRDPIESTPAQRLREVLLLLAERSSITDAGKPGVSVSPVEHETPSYSPTPR